MKQAAIIGSALALLAGLAPAQAGSFCDDLKTMLGAAPRFETLRGEQTGMEYDGSLKFEGSTQCDLRNKSDLDNNWQPINDKWSYECLWENTPPGALDWLHDQVAACLPEASYSNQSQFAKESFASDFQGGVFHDGENAIAIDYNLTTNQLWLTVYPPGVMK
ncbi:MAG: hypothetical protein KGJ78_13585 [Alphaproteobacteria bacterium]|nr:hypothetical protein [Alphaproteobacteria bacterium]